MRFSDLPQRAMIFTEGKILRTFFINDCETFLPEKQSAKTPEFTFSLISSISVPEKENMGTEQKEQIFFSSETGK